MTYSSPADKAESYPCPVCGTGGVVCRRLDAQILKRELAAYFGSDVPPTTGIIDYSLIRCPRCTLEYAWPLEPGTGPFYDWITAQSGYFTPERWEWERIIEELAPLPAGATLLEVGCGSGLFLQRLSQRTKVRGIGLDTTVGVVEECRSHGVEAYAQRLEIFSPATARVTGGFDFVATFHCLEHIPNPVGFVQDMAAKLKPNGRIYISTPYSPMYFEHGWFDPLNHPPHHMTRWNSAAYTELGKRVGMELRLILPKPASAPSRALTSLSLARNGRPRPDAADTRLRVALTHPIAAARELFFQLRAPRVQGQAAPNVVLVELSKSS